MRKNFILYLLFVVIFTLLTSVLLYIFFDFFPKDYFVVNYIFSILNLFIWTGIWIALIIWYLNNLEEQKRKIFEILLHKLNEIKELNYKIKSDEKYSAHYLKLQSYNFWFDEKIQKIDVKILENNDIFSIVKNYEFQKISDYVWSFYLQLNLFWPKLDNNMKNILKLEHENIWNFDFYKLVYIYSHWKSGENINIHDNKLYYWESESLKEIISILKKNDF